MRRSCSQIKNAAVLHSDDRRALRHTLDAHLLVAWRDMIPARTMISLITPGDAYYQVPANIADNKISDNNTLQFYSPANKYEV